MLDVEQHVAPIAQIEPLDAGGVADDRSFGGVSQFVSIDDSGVIMFWVTSSLSSASASSAQDLDRGSAVLAAAPGSSSSSSSSSGGHGSSSSSGGLASAADLGRSPWSKVSLLQTRRLQVTSSIPRSVAPSPSSSSSSSSSSSTFSQRPKQDSGRSVSGPSDRGSGLQAPRAVLSTLPQDLSTLLVAAPGGSVLKLARFGAAAHPHALKRDERTQFLQNLSSGGGEEERKSMGGKEVKYFTSVSAMGVRSCCYRPSRSREPEPEWAGAQGSDLSFSVALVLVGRTDGSVDLFRSDCEGPLQSWSLSSSSSSSSSCAVVLLRHGRCDHLPALHSPNLTCSALSCPLDRWIPHRPAAFLAVDSAGRLFLFDLLRDAGGPVGTEQLSTETKLSAQMLDVSGARPSSSSSSSSFQYRRDALHIAVASGGSVGPFVRRLNRMTLDRPAGPGTRKSRSRSGGEGKAEGEDAQQEEEEEEEEELEEERLLLDAMSRFAAKTAMQQFVTTLPAAADLHLK